MQSETVMGQPLQTKPTVIEDDDGSSDGFGTFPPLNPLSPSHLAMLKLEDELAASMELDGLGGPLTPPRPEGGQQSKATSSQDCQDITCSPEAGPFNACSTHTVSLCTSIRCDGTLLESEGLKVCIGP